MIISIGQYMGKKSNSTDRELYRAAIAMDDMVRLAVPHIRERGQSQPAVYIGLYFNLGFSVELYLKAFLKNKTGEDVSKYGHDLKAVLTSAVDNGFDIQKDAMTDIVNALSDDHKSLTFRYGNDSKPLPYLNNLDLVLIVLDDCCKGMSYISDQS